MPVLRHLSLGGWRQFGDVNVDFDPHLTILTGANGAGKTTILHILAHFLGWNVPFVATPRVDPRGRLEYITALFARMLHPNDTRVGTITMDDGSSIDLGVPSSGGPTYQLNITGSTNIEGSFIPSHRPVFSYSPVSGIPPRARSRAEIGQTYRTLVQARYQSGAGYQQSPTFSLKENLIALAVYGYGNPAVIPDADARENFEAFNDILRQLLPPSLGFRKLAIHSPEVVLETSTGDFSIDSVSGGIASLIDMAWLIYMTVPRSGGQFVVIIDEPENHLHPELQVHLIPALLRAFPTAQYVLATHNPLIVSSTAKSNVYALRYDEYKLVFSTLLDFVDKSGTADEILREVLGLTSVTPEWVQQQIDEAVLEFEQSAFTDESLAVFRQRLIALGLDKYIVRSISELAKAQHVE